MHTSEVIRARYALEWLAILTLAPASEASNGRFVTSDWNDAAGQNVFRYTLTKGRGHSIIPAEMRLLWDWYELWQRDADGNMVYVGP